MDILTACLRLALTEGIGPVSGRQLLAAFRQPEDIFRASTDALQRAGLNAPQIAAIRHDPPDDAMATARDWASNPAHHLLALGDPRYPPRLASLHDAPLVLYVIGDTDVLHTPQLAIVGSRKPSRSAADTARAFAASLATAGLTITSGMALGIDGEAHRGCLEANGLTVGVAATGLDSIYPARHRELAHQIVAQGAMISEYPLGTRVNPAYFTRRNRLISGLSAGTLVVEAAIRSGSLTTAKHATEQGREVMAIPGSIHNPLARGCHQLIRQGAKLVETADDVLEELAGQLGPLHFPPNTAANAPAASNDHTAAEQLDPQYAALLDCLDFTPQAVDQLVACCQLPAQEVASMLLILELQGLAASAGANRYIRCK
ncbi:MAG TPA: DNA-protecting protein DprA [Gammaproteobacteria bacterium]|jgi:DNA processing protein|nr:DNA-protecting protein DprA [Gammaproteobacteria bacterium]